MKYQYFVVTGNGMAVCGADDTRIFILPESVDVGAFAIEDDIDGLEELAVATIPVNRFISFAPRLIKEAIEGVDRSQFAD